MIYEMRIYDVLPEGREALYNRFRDNALDLLARHRFHIIGMWEPSDGREKLFYLLRWDSADARERAWHAFRNDPDWIRVKAAAEAGGPIVSKMEFFLLQDAPFFLDKNVPAYP